jgi:cytochrome c6
VRWVGLLAIVAVTLAGCGGGTKQGAPTLANGAPSGQPRAVFIGVCGSCHTLADAGTHGKAGPNLDRLQPAAHDVQDVIAVGKGAMPAHLLAARDGAEVARYVASVAGR